MNGDWQLGHMPLNDYVKKHNEIANEIVTDELKKSALFLLKEGIAPEIVAQANKLPLETVLQLQKEIELQNA